MTDQPMFLDTCSLAHPLLPVVFYLKWLQQGVLLRSVAREIAALAHSSEPDERAVSQRAAMAVTILHSFPHVSVVCDPEPPLSWTVDEDLLLRAANDEGRLCTEDSGLQEQARQQRVEVISIQSFDWELAPLAAALAAIYPPLQPLGHGHLLRVRIEKGGYQPH